MGHPRLPSRFTEGCATRPDLLQDFQKDISPASRLQQSESSITTAGDEMKIAAAVDSAQPFGHGPKILIPPFASQKKFRKEWGPRQKGWATLPPQ